MKKQFYLLILFFCFQSNYSQKLLDVEIFFNKDWEYLGMGYHNENNGMVVYLKDFSFDKLQLVKYLRKFKMSEKLMNDYSNGNTIYPDCSGSDSDGLFRDYYFKTTMADAIKNDAIKNKEEPLLQFRASRPYSMGIDSNNKDFVINNGSVFYFKEDNSVNQSLKSENYIRVFDNGDNYVSITPDYDLLKNVTGCNYEYSVIENSKYQVVCNVLVSKVWVGFVFINNSKNEEMHYIITSEAGLSAANINIKNNVVYEKGTSYSNPIAKNKSANEFLIDFFKDNPKMKLRMLNNANKMPNNDKTGLSYDGIIKAKNNSNLTIEKILQYFIYESFIGGYSNSKTLPCNFYYDVLNKNNSLQNFYETISCY